MESYQNFPAEISYEKFLDESDYMEPSEKGSGHPQWFPWERLHWLITVFLPYPSGSLTVPLLDLLL